VAQYANGGTEMFKERLKSYNIHASETAWVGTDFDFVLENNETIDELYTQVQSIVTGRVPSRLDATERPLYVGLADSLHI
jgi:hypothetical protein